MPIMILTMLMLKVGELEKSRTKLLFYIVKYGPNNTKEAITYPNATLRKKKQ